MQPQTTNPSLQAVLVETNVRWLRQALLLLERLDDTAYSTPPRGFEPHKAGAHLRHIVEFYRCFLEGLESSHIDYDSRRRDPGIEVRRDTAAFAIREIVKSLRTHCELQGQRVLWVHMEDADGSPVCESFMESSVNRELQVLSSHTVHHFALMAMTLRMHGVEMDPDFGMAPSTLRYLASRKVEAA